MNSPSNNKPMILVVSHVIPYPPSAGNEIRILKMLKWFQEQGYNIILLLNQEKVNDDLRKKLELIFDHIHLISDDYEDEAIRRTKRYFKAELSLFKLFKNSNIFHIFSGINYESKTKSIELKKWFASDQLMKASKYLYNKYKPIIVMVEYIFTSPCLKAIPEGVLKIIDTHDMFSRKREQVIKYGIDDLLWCTRREERHYLLNANLIIAIQSHEARMFQRLVAERDVITVGIDFDILSELDNSSVVPGTILIVGSDNALNIHGLHEFYSKAWPEIKLKHPIATLCVVGKLANCLQTEDTQVRLSGWVNDLNEEYRKAAVVVNPTFAGTGLKIKSVEALCNGKALVSTPNGVEGIEAGDIEAPYQIALDWASFATKVVLLLKSDDKRNHLQKCALKYAQENFYKDKIYTQLKERLKNKCVHLTSY